MITVGVASDTRTSLLKVLKIVDTQVVAWLKIIPQADATGALAAAYAAVNDRPMPPVYKPSHGDAAGIIRTHSLDPELLRLTFSVSGALATTGLPWADRETLASATSLTNQCFY